MIVYILHSESLGNYYVGQTKDVAERLIRHNMGRVKSTKRGKPWIIIKLIEVESRTEAMTLEAKIKGRGIKRFLEYNNFGM